MSKNHDECCAICGNALGLGGHKCPVRSLRAIDAAHRRSVDDVSSERRPSYGQRLQDGFARFFPDNADFDD